MTVCVICALLIVAPPTYAGCDSVRSVNSVDEMRALDTGEIADGQQVMVRGYHAGTDVGGGCFVWDSSSTEQENGGTIFAADDADEGRWKRVDVRKIDWRDFGINQTTLSGEEFQAPFDYGIANGFREFVLPGHDMTLTGPVHLTIPDDVSESVSIVGDGKLSFEYPWGDEGRQRLFRIIGNGRTRADVRLSLDGEGMGRYPDGLRVATGLRIDKTPSSTVRLHVEEIYGFGLRIHNSPGSDLHITAINCDGQKVTKDPDTGAHDHYGDGIYVATTNVTLHSPVVTTENGGRGGIVFESFESRTSGTVLNPYVEGYDRGIHVEGGRTTSGNVLIDGGRIVDCNSGVWNFSSGGIVTCRGVSFENNRQVSQNVIASSVMAYVTTYERASRTRTEACVFNANNHPAVSRAIFCGGSHVSTGDLFRPGSGRIDTANARSFTISGFTANGNTRVEISNTETARISSGTLGGNILLPNTNNYRIEDVTMRVPEGGTFCGIIVSVNKKGGTISNVEFQNPESYCIDNYRNQSGGVLPVYEAITAIRRTPESSPRILRYQPGANGSHNYTSSRPSYIVDEVAGGVTRIPPRIAE